MTFVICAALLAFSGGLSWFAAQSKSPTMDEPLHAMSAWLQLHRGDFRVDPEDPPLWKYWAAIPNGRNALDVPADSPLFRSVADDLYHEWQYVVDTFYRIGDGVNAARADDFIQRSRGMMILLGLALGALIAWWGWQLAGSTASLAAIALFCLDPNFLAHSALVKNDVPMTLCATGLILAVWRAGRRLTILNALAIGLLCAASVNVKFSGLLFGPIVATLLVVRALVFDPWDTFWRRLNSRGEKLVMSAIVIAAAALISFAGIWACYGFRFLPSSDPSLELNQKRMSIYAANAEFTRENNGKYPTTQQIEAWKPSLMTQVILTMDDMHFLPQAWLNGLFYTYQSALARKTFLLGNYSELGWWYYFPLAMLFKTPLATLLAGIGAIGVLIVAIRRDGTKWMRNWTTWCLVLPPAVYLLSAMRSNLNLGLRHVLPVYPFLFLLIALAVVQAWNRWRLAMRWVCGGLAIGLAAETLAAFPNFLAFFNAASGGSRGGIRLLGDSNLDWGQDLKLLAQWRQDHPTTNLYLVYFGLADPWAYGIKYVNFPGGYGFGPAYETRSDPGVLAISATNLQGIYISPALRESYGRLLDQEPIDVLGGTIYLYRWPPQKPVK